MTPRASGWLLVVFPPVLAALVAVRAQARVLRHVPWSLMIASLVLVGVQLGHREFDATVAAQLLMLVWAFAAARTLRPLTETHVRRVWQGIVAGLSTLAALALLEVLGAGAGLAALADLLDGVVALVGVEVAPRGAGPGDRATLLAQHPNVLAATVLVPAFAALTARRGLVPRLLVLTPTALLLVLTGSRSALVGAAAGLLVLVVLEFMAGGGSKRVIATGGALVLTTVVVLVAVQQFAPGVLGRLVPGATLVAATENLLQASEDLSDGVWWRPFVAVEPARAGPQAGTRARVPAEWSLTRVGGGPVDRVQQRVTLAAGGTYLFTFEFARPEPASRPGLIAWGSTSGVTTSLVVSETASGEWRGAAAGSLALLAVDVDAVDATWTRVAATFQVTDSDAVVLEVGVAPDMSQPPSDSPLHVRAVQLRQRDEGESAAAALLEYSPSYAPDRAGLRASSAIATRQRVYAAAWRAVAERPLFGHGPSGFQELRQSSEDPLVRAAGHEHSLLLWVALRYGLVGVAALTLLVVGLVRREPRYLPAVAAVLVANLFDLTFWSAGVYLSLALVVGTPLLATRAGSREGAG